MTVKRSINWKKVPTLLDTRCPNESWRIVTEPLSVSSKTVADKVFLIGTPCLLSYVKKKIRNSILRSQKENRVKMLMGREAFLPKNFSNHCSIQT
jgi:hypothetical protein